MTDKTDLKKTFDAYRATRGAFRIVDVPDMRYLMVDGHGEDMFTTAVERAGAKSQPARLDAVRLETLSEGRCVQTLHVGSFDDEAEVLRRMHHEFIPGGGLRAAGRHHEIYLSDHRKVAPEKQRTILRQPITGT
jgi:hypothetical protein